ncbi:MAG: hypothetical protein MUD16_12350 [Desulfobacterales bacterium]|jgi:hypothetical protein|nr:hypothetical protein [Desulfobacterales bacterium]
MKKTLSVVAVLLLALPAMAADWSFYGSQRMSTFYVHQDFGDGTVNGNDDDWGLNWNFQTNSRMGARVRADKVSGQIELALRAANNGDGGDEGVTTRRAFGVWSFADGAALKVGKDYSPVSQLFSNQVFNNDDDLEGSGAFHGRRPAGLSLIIGGLEVALLNNPLKTSTGQFPADSDPDYNLPKVEARYALKLDSFTVTPFAGFNYFRISDTPATRAAGTLTGDADITSYVAGLNIKAIFGAFSATVEGTYGQNWSNANWKNGYNAVTASQATLKSTGGSTNDADSFMLGIVCGFKATDRLKFELGAAYRSDDPNSPGSKEDTFWQSYLQAVVTLAPGVYLVPEAGYQDFMDNTAGNDEGYTWYAGAKWQIDF